jgi:hypothetical protein
LYSFRNVLGSYSIQSVKIGSLHRSVANEQSVDREVIGGEF